MLAAASLSEVVTELAVDFEHQNPDIKIMVSSAGSATLREQLAAGAPADVFIPASAEHVRAAAEHRGFTTDGVAIATNRVALAVRADNPAGVTELAELAHEHLLVGLCDPAVPCGALAQRWLTKAGVTARPDTLTLNVTDLATKLMVGELDVGVVYATDVGARAGLAEVSTSWLAPSTTYVAAVLTDAPNPKGAQRFVAHLTSQPAAEMFERYGFGPASAQVSS